MTELAQQLIEREKRECSGYLDLGNCGLTELPDLSELDWLETLIVSNKWWNWEERKWINSQNTGEPNKIAAPPERPLPESLKKVILGGDYRDKWTISDWGFLEKLTGLTTLDLSDNRISDGRFLENLTGLTTLDLRDNQISDGRFLEKLTGLTTLYLQSNQINDGRFLENLTGLTTLNLSSNQISEGRFLEKLTGLTTLNLSSNQISDWRFLEKLTGLTTLYLTSNQISDWRFLEKLTGLTTLYLRSNQISDGLFLEKLTGLTTLNLSYNQISDGRFLENLTDLTTLYLSYNQISDGRFLEKLAGLTTLYLSNNQISDGRFLENLTGLTTLYLSNNQISDISFLQHLNQLEKLDISNNQTEDLSPALHLIKKGNRVVWKEWYETGVREINVKDNPLNNPPRAIVKKGNAAILEYFEQKAAQGARPLLEAKLVLLGDGRAGKTSLANRLLHKPLPTEADRTRGVDIVIGEYGFPVAEGDFTLHIWDFAGQDKYKPLHQFFYTEGAVYVLVADSGNAGTDFNDWLQTAELFGEGSPLVIALNEFRDGIGRGAFDEERWRKQFPQLLKDVQLVNLLSEKGFAELERCIRYHTEQLPHARVEYPNNWAAIRAELERRRDENYISQKEYFRICRDNELPERESALILSGILHKIGVCLHYQKSELLRQHVILKNEWATQAVYQILEDEQVADVKKGFFDWDDLRRIWADDDYAEMRPQLLELMQQFKMAYPLPNRTEFATPPLLPAAPPGDWDLPDSPTTIELYVEYKFLPKALMTQFIVSRHADIDRGRTLVWRNGAVLRWSADTVAEVKAFKSRGRDAFYIRAQGSERRGLLTAILKTLRELHADYGGIGAYEIAPCPCSVCRAKKNDSEKHFFDFANLQNRLERGRRTVECDLSLEEVDLVQLLGDLLVFEHLSVGQRVVLKEVASPVVPDAEPKTIRIFLASSAELAEDRKALRQFISEKNDRFRETGKGLYLLLENWEAMSGVLSPTRKQDDYNERILESDLFICLAHTKVGRYTEEEFDLAWATFQKTGQPRLLTFFKKDGVDPLTVQDSLRQFHVKLTTGLEHFPDAYQGYAELEGKVWKEIERIGSI